MVIWDAFKNGIARFERVLQEIGQICVFLIMAVTVANIVSRFVLYAFPGAVEASIALLVFVVFLGLPFTQNQRGHVRMELVINLFKPRTREFFEILALFISFGILTIMFWQTTEVGLRAFEVKTYQPGLISFPTWPGKLIIPFSLFFFLIRIAIQIIGHMQHLKIEPSLKKNPSGK